MFENKNFVHLHNHTEMSQFDGLAKVSDFVLQARKMGFPAIAVTDHGNVMSFIKFLQECKAKSNKKGDIPYAPIKAILGEEFYLARQMDVGQNKDIYDKNGKKLEPKDIQPDGRKGNRHLNIYAMNWEGYQNLCSLSQMAWTDGFYSDPRIDVELLSKHSKGLMGGSACLASLININLLHDRYDVAKKVAGTLNEIFYGNFFLEVMYHGIPEEKAIIPEILKLSSELNIPVCATNDCHYIFKEHADSQEVLMCMSSSRCLKDPKRMSFSYKEFYLKSAEEMYQLFKDVPHVLTNTLAINEKIDTDDIERNLFGGMRLPKFPLPEGYNDPFVYLEKIAWSGLKKNGWENSEKHVVALKKELADVKCAKENNNYDFATYFLIVQDYIRAANEMGILTGPGRGSGYASVLLRCLDITWGIDPLGEGISMLWERFLAFQDLRFIKESDFGFSENENIPIEVEDIEVEEDRDIENDLGGVDRY